MFGFVVSVCILYGPFCNGALVPLHLINLHCFKHSFFEHLFNYNNLSIVHMNIALLLPYIATFSTLYVFAWCTYLGHTHYIFTFVIIFVLHNPVDNKLRSVLICSYCLNMQQQIIMTKTTAAREPSTAPIIAHDWLFSS